MPGLPPQREIPAFAFAADVPGVIQFQAGEFVSGRPRYSIFTFGCKIACEWPADISQAVALQSLETVLGSLDSSAPAFCGLAGYISYDAAPIFEPACAVRRDHGTPLLRLVHVDICHVFDRQTGTATIQTSPRCSPDRQTQFLKILNAPIANTTIQQSEIPLNIAPHGELNRGEYSSRVSEIQERIRAGQFYECNFTQRFRAESAIAPREMASAILPEAHAPHASYFEWSDLAIISASPELFLRRSGQHLTTRPIKGSLARTGPADSAERAQLRQNPKDRAEHTMVIDLARNDLGRVCEFGSVAVTDAHSIETFPRVHHMVSSVHGKLRPNVSTLDILKATFPPASITGAPKIKVTHAIRDFEISPRGIYTGAIGWFSPDGDFELNVAIRTLVATRSLNHFIYECGAGGAIVADSDPTQEYEECLMKARPLLEPLLPA